MEVLCENASRSQQCGEETAKGFVSLPGLRVKETSPGAWEGWWQECGQEDWGQGGGGKDSSWEAPPYPPSTVHRPSLGAQDTDPSSQGHLPVWGLDYCCPKELPTRTQAPSAAPCEYWAQNM